MINVMRTQLQSPMPDCPLNKAAQSTQARTLHRACVVVGGAARLAAALHVSEAAVRAWLEARAEVPDLIFLGALEIVLLDLEAPRTPGA